MCERKKAGGNWDGRFSKELAQSGRYSAEAGKITDRFTKPSFLRRDEAVKKEKTSCK